MRLEMTRWQRTRAGDWDCMDTQRLTPTELEGTVDELNQLWGVPTIQGGDDRVLLTWRPRDNVKIEIDQRC